MTSSFANLRYELSATTGVLTITINRPTKLNALNAATLIELGEAARQAQNDPAVRGILLTGAGDRAFVAWAGIAEFADLGTEAAKEFAKHGQQTLALFERSPKPVVAAIKGFALGGCCELAMACHIRVAAENARFGQPEVNLGIIPCYGGTQCLVQLMGKGKALELMMSADQPDAKEALRLGLVNHVVPAAELLAFCEQLLMRIKSKAPAAVANVVQSVAAYFDAEQKGYAAEAQLFANCCQTQDFREGVAVFVEKRAAHFAGQ